jgi:uncharacterized protein YcsI (UPF0317 family)
MTSTALAARLAIRRGQHRGPTAGLAPGYVQGNLVILPQSYAADFLLYCTRNPKACPLIGMSAPGYPHIPALGADLDIRTDLPQYCLWENGEFQRDADHLRDLWRGDLVAFVIGCSFSFEAALIEADIPLRHVEQGKNVSMYRTGIATEVAGPFGGPLVVSMRPLSPADAIRAIQITSRFPRVHGAPVHFGDPAAIGIADLARPDFGEPADVRPGEVPVFWACGVTPQSAIMAAKPPISITHKPGCMLVTDVRNSALAAS